MRKIVFSIIVIALACGGARADYGKTEVDAVKSEAISLDSSSNNIKNELWDLWEDDIAAKMFLQTWLDNHWRDISYDVRR